LAYRTEKLDQHGNAESPDPRLYDKTAKLRTVQAAADDNLQMSKELAPCSFATSLNRFSSRTIAQVSRSQ
jgi:hypothetical protein